MAAATCIQHSRHLCGTVKHCAKAGRCPTGALETRRSRHPSPSHHSSLKATTDLSCPVQGSLLLGDMGSLASIWTFTRASTPAQLESGAHVPTCELQGPHAPSRTGCPALGVPSWVQGPCTCHVYHLLTHHSRQGDVMPDCGIVLPQGPEPSAPLGRQDDAPGHVHRGPSNNN